MKYIDEFRSPRLIIKTVRQICKIIPSKEVNIMEVCGTHTHNFRKFGLEKLLPSNLRFISGPGCPVCVSDQSFIDSSIDIARNRDTIITTFGDMLRVPGRRSTLERERGSGADIRVVYSPLDALQIAQSNPGKKIVFLAVGFETTAPAIALSIKAAKTKKIKNISFFCALKLMPPAMSYLLKDKRLKIDGFLCPGHVSSIIGSTPYEFIPKKYKIPCCVAGFEPLDILEGILLILEQIVKGRAIVSNQYSRVVKKQGNPQARKIMYGVFQAQDALWRGLGEIPQSGLKIKNIFSSLDTEKIFKLKRDMRYEM